MIKSMTGYGRSRQSLQGISVQAELRALNSRYLDLQISLPDSFRPIEDKIRRKIKEDCIRGKIIIFVTVEPDVKTTNGSPQFDRKKFETYASVVKLIYQEYGEKIPLASVIDLKELIADVEPAQVGDDFILAVVHDAIRDLCKMREEEGRVIGEDCLKRTGHLDHLLQEIEKMKDEVMSQILNGYRIKIQNLMGNMNSEGKTDVPAKLRLDEVRIVQEVAILAEKSDITEECVRMESHIHQFRDLFTQDEPEGKRLNFLLQEMNREVNCIASKANHLRIIQYTLEMKNEIEKLREQIQNVL